MKKQIDLLLLATVVGGLLFNLLFWNEGLGINLLFYSAFIGLILFLNPEVAKEKKTVFFGILHVLSAILAVYNHSQLTLTSWYVSLAIFVGFAFQTHIRSVFTAIAATLVQLVHAPISIVQRISKVRLGAYSAKPLIKILKYAVIPIVLVGTFAAFYRYANPTFASYLDAIVQNIGNFFIDCFNFLFGEISFARFLHVLLGILVSSIFLLKYHHQKIVEWEVALREYLIRKKKSDTEKKRPSDKMNLLVANHTSYKKKTLGLKVENLIGILSFSALNLLILFLNGIDIFTLWIKSNELTLNVLDYSSDLHDGTNALISSIIMAMGVILYFFRGNLNFYRKNKIIVGLVYLWIAQNAFLVASVFLRDYHYIEAHGLTYKRIGVIVFLMLCLIGLFTVFTKVSKRRTLFYLVRVNGMVWYVILLISCFFNWDAIIVNYNIRHSDTAKIDVRHLLSLSDKTLPTLYSNRATIEKMRARRSIVSTEEVDRALERKALHFQQKTSGLSWLSWNYRDWQTQRHLKQKDQILITKGK